MNKNTIIYDASTPYMLMVAWITAYLYRMNNHNILLLNRTFLDDPDRLRQRILHTRVFQEVVLIQDHSSFNLSSLSKHFLERTVAYHMASYGSFYAIKLYEYCIERKIPVILNEEGMATYILYESYDSFYNRFSKYGLVKIDLDKIAEIWVFNKSLYRSKSLEKVKEIELWNHICDPINLKKIVDGLNHIYGFKYTKPQEKMIFFSQNFYAYNSISKEEQLEFYQRIAQLFNNSIMFKLHPIESPNIYKESLLPICLYPNFTPWEVVLLNMYLNDNMESMIFFSVASTSLFSQYIFFHKNIASSRMISIFHLAPSAIQNIIETERFKEFETIARKIDNFFIPQSFEELREITTSVMNER